MHDLYNTIFSKFVKLKRNSKTSMSFLWFLRYFKHLIHCKRWQTNKWMKISHRNYSKIFYWWKWKSLSPNKKIVICLFFCWIKSLPIISIHIFNHFLYRIPFQFSYSEFKFQNFVCCAHFSPSTLTSHLLSELSKSSIFDTWAKLLMFINKQSCTYLVKKEDFIPINFYW